MCAKSCLIRAANAPLLPLFSQDFLTLTSSWGLPIDWHAPAQVELPFQLEATYQAAFAFQMAFRHHYASASLLSAQQRIDPQVNSLQ
jgi:hypothetical protein